MMDRHSRETGLTYGELEMKGIVANPLL